MNNTDHKLNQNADQQLSALLLVLNAIILEQSITANTNVCWWLLASIPLLVFMVIKSKPFTSH